MRTNYRHSRHKAQSEILSTILVIGISLAAVSVAYLWGLPLIEKGQSSNKLQSVETTMLFIADSVSEVVKAGGQKPIELSLDGPLEISVADNAIIYSFTSKKAGVATTEWTPMNEDETFGINGTFQNQTVAIYGNDKSGVLIARAIPGNNEYLTEYRLVFRELDDVTTREGYLIMLESLENSKVLSGRHTLTINRGTPAISTTDSSRLGGPLIITQVFLTLS